MMLDPGRTGAGLDNRLQTVLAGVGRLGDPVDRVAVVHFGFAPAVGLVAAGLGAPVDEARLEEVGDRLRALVAGVHVVGALLFGGAVEDDGELVARFECALAPQPACGGDDVVEELLATLIADAEGGDGSSDEGQLAGPGADGEVLRLCGDVGVARVDHPKRHALGPVPSAVEVEAGAPGDVGLCQQGRGGAQGEEQWQRSGHGSGLRGWIGGWRKVGQSGPGDLPAEGGGD